MIFEIYLNDEIIFYPNDDRYAVENAVLSEELGAAGSLEFDIYSNNPQYGNFTLNSSYVSVIRDGKEVFYGKVTEINDELDGKRHVYVRGILAELYDVIAPKTTAAFSTDANTGLAKKIFNQYMKTHVCKTNKNHLKFSVHINEGFVGSVYVCKEVMGGRYSSRIKETGEYIVDATQIWLFCSVSEYTGSEDYIIDVFDWDFTDEETNIEWSTDTYRRIPENVTADPLNIKIEAGNTGSFNLCSFPFSHIENGSIYPRTFTTQRLSGVKDVMTEMKERLYSVTDLYPYLVSNYGGNNNKHMYLLFSQPIENIGKASNQPIVKGRNLLDFERTLCFDSVCSHLYPYAIIQTEDGEEILTIETASQGDGMKYMYSLDIETEYGVIEKSVEFSDVETANELYSKAHEYFLANNRQYITYEATALDMSVVDSSLDTFEVGDRVKLTVDDLKDVEVPIRAKTTYINDLTKSEIKVGGKIRKKLTDKVSYK